MSRKPVGSKKRPSPPESADDGARPPCPVAGIGMSAGGLEARSIIEHQEGANEEVPSTHEQSETLQEDSPDRNEDVGTVNDELQERNSELAASNDDLLNLLASIEMPVVMLDRDLRIRRFTPLAERVLNLIPPDIGRPLRDVRLGVDVPDLASLLDQSLTGQAPPEREVRDAQGRRHMLRFRPYRAQREVVAGVVLMLVDVDDVMRGREDLRRQAELLAQAREPILAWQLDSGELRSWNAGAEEVYGYPAAEALGRNVHELLRTVPPDEPFLPALQRSGGWKGELMQVRRDDRRIVVESRMALVRDAAQGQLVIETSRDVSDRKRMELALRERTAELVEADRVKNEFLAMLAHELRNPLAPLLNAAELLKRRGPEAVGPLQDLIERQVRRMSRMINDLLDVSRVTQGKLEMRRLVVDVGSLLQQSAEMARDRITVRGQHLEIRVPEQPVFVDADPVRLEQVFANLLDNASKFTPAGGHIRVSATPEPAGASRPSSVIVHVSDDGAGIDDSMQARVFDLFVQGSAGAPRAQAGLGIGLMLVKRLVELHGGSVAVSSPGAGKGSDFMVRLPAVPAPHRPRPRSHAPRRPLPPCRILVVDDNVDAAVTTAELLRLQGHEVLVAHDGAEALRRAREAAPRAAFLDVGLPDIDGFTLAREIRTALAPRKIAVFATTGYSHAAEGVASDPAFDEILGKPVALDELLRAMSDHVGEGKGPGAESG